MLAISYILIVPQFLDVMSSFLCHELVTMVDYYETKVSNFGKFLPVIKSILLFCLISMTNVGGFLPLIVEIVLLCLLFIVTYRSGCIR